MVECEETVGIFRSIFLASQLNHLNPADWGQREAASIKYSDSVLHFAISCLQHPKIQSIYTQKNENTCNNQLKVLEILVYKHSK